MDESAGQIILTLLQTKYMLKHSGSIQINTGIEVINDRLVNNVDTKYFLENMQKWPSNNIEFCQKGKSLYGQADQNGFYISGKHKVFSRNIDSIEIKGKYTRKASETLIEYEIKPKAHKLIILIVINLMLTGIVMATYNRSELDGERSGIYSGIFIILLLVNILIPLGIKKELKSAEKKLIRMLTTP